MLDINDAIDATASKLKDGSWGARVKTHAVEKGDTVKINTKAGSHFFLRVSKVIWQGEYQNEQVSLVSTERLTQDDQASLEAQETSTDQEAEGDQSINPDGLFNH